MRTILSALVLAVAALAAGSASAHAHLVAASPTPNSTVHQMGTLRLSFSERLVGQFSGAEVTAVALPRSDACCRSASARTCEHQRGWEKPPRVARATSRRGCLPARLPCRVS